MKKYIAFQIILAFGICSYANEPALTYQLASEETESEEVTSTTTTATVETTTTTSKESDSPKFTLSPRGRLLLDGALYAPDKEGFSDGVAIPDVRLGVRAIYGKWTGIIEVGYGFGKLSAKDIYLQYNFNDYNLLRAGYFVYQFGLNAATSASMKPTMVAPSTDTFFGAFNRNLGIEYVYDRDKWFVAASIVGAGNNFTTKASAQGKISVGAINRTVFRPLHSEGNIAQAGVSFWYMTAQHERLTNEAGESYISPGYFNMTANFPTEVSQVSMLQAEVTDAKGSFRFSPEWLLAKGRIALEGQYYYMNIARKHDLSAYSAQGVYALLRGMVIGKNYGYSHVMSSLATPAPKSLELVLGYNYTNANCSKAGIYGGITNDYSATFTYYINKYMLARLRYSYTDVRNSAVTFNRHVNIIQLRLQAIF